MILSAVSASAARLLAVVLAKVTSESRLIAHAA
jgi:hypothetical protein